MIDRAELEMFFSEVASDGHSVTKPAIETGYMKNIILTICVNMVIHFSLLFIMTILNRELSFGFAIDDFPLLLKVNPLIIASGQFLFSTLLMLPFCIRDFVNRFQHSMGGVILTAVPYVASITSSLAHGYFFNPPPYYQIRSFSISCAFFVGFFNTHFHNFPDTIIAIGMMICGTLLSAGRSLEFYFPFLMFGFASSLASVLYPLGIRSSIRYFRRKFILLAFSLNLCSFLMTLPCTLVCADFKIFQHPDFNITRFMFYLILSGMFAGVLCLTSAILIYFSSPLHYIVMSTVRSSCMLLWQAYRNPLRRVLTPAMFLGNWVCMAAGVMVFLFHMQKLKQKAGVPWVFPRSLWKLLGLLD